MSKKFHHKYDLSYDLQQVLPELLKSVPEIVQSYNRMKAEKENIAYPQAYLEEMDSLSEAHGLPPQDPRLPGMIIVFEDLLVPQIVEFVQNSKNERLSSVLEWIETLANSEHFAVTNLVAGSICEPLVTTHSRYLAQIHPYFGKKTLEMCRMVAGGYKVSSEVTRILANNK